MAFAALPSLRITRTSTAEQVAEALGSAILDGKLLPEAPLREVELAEALSVSRNTVREAIRLLVGRGLAVHRMHRGAAVVRLDEHDVADLYGVRRVLELAGLSVEAPRRGHVERFRLAATTFDEAANLRETPALVAQDVEFHASIVGLLGSPRLERFFEQIQAEMRLALSIISRVDREYLRANEIAAEHRAIFDAFISGDRDAACRLMLVHLDTNEARLREIIAPLDAGLARGEA